MSYTSTAMQHAFDERSFDMQVILPRLAALNVFNPEGLLSDLVRMLSEALHSDRITHSIVDSDSQRILAMAHVGMDTPLEEEVVAGKVILKAMNDGRAQIVGNMSEMPELSSVRSEDYKTNGCAVLPLSFRGVKLGALCMSNLSATQVTGLLVQKREVDLFTEFVSLLTVIQMQRDAANGNNDFEVLLGKIAEQPV
jgi:LytS/YehU family sensor histidine kinase